MPAPEPDNEVALAPPPPVAADVFGAALGAAQAYAAVLTGAGIDRGLLGPAEAARVWERHLINCAPLARLVAHGARVVDVGSGAGLPGVVLALMRPDLTITLLDAQARRCEFLTEVVDKLHLGGAVTVVHGRAEDGLPGARASTGGPEGPAAAGGVADVVTARAIAPLERLIPLCAPLLRVSGELLAMKGSRAAAEVAAASRVLERYDATATIVRLDLPGGLAGTTVIRVSVDRPQPRRARSR